MSWSTEDVAGLMLGDLLSHSRVEHFGEGFGIKMWVDSHPTFSTKPAQVAHLMRKAGTQPEFIHRELRRRFPTVTLLNVYRAVGVP